MIGEDGKWKKVTVAEARNFKDTNLIWWRPNMLGASHINPEEDSAFILEDVSPIKRVK